MRVRVVDKRSHHYGREGELIDRLEIGVERVRVRLDEVKGARGKSGKGIDWYFGIGDLEMVEMLERRQGGR